MTVVLHDYFKSPLFPVYACGSCMAGGPIYTAAIPIWETWVKKLTSACSNDETYQDLHSIVYALRLLW